ncbi:MAG: SLBB domain-containing protein [Cyanobacteria bacterium P01_C01_bin.118]
MKTVQPVRAHLHSVAPPIKKNLFSLNGRLSNAGMIIKAAYTLLLGSVSAGLVGTSALAQLPPLESPSTTVPPENIPVPVTSGPSTVALESYILGPGDQIRVDVLVDFIIFEDPIDQIVLLDGSLTLPWIGKVDVAGLNPIQAEAKVVDAYSLYIRKPRITFQLLQPRPLRVGIAGQIKRPGGYTLQVNSEAGEGSEDSEGRTRFWPTLSQAISQAGGITRSADVRSVEITREGLFEPIKVNLWDLVETGDLRQDVLLRDGDRIIVPTAESIDSSEVITLANTTFAPTSIKINVIGEVKAPGSISVPPNTPLNQAVLTAGGFNSRARTGRVELIRLNPNGNVTQRSVDIDLAEAVNEEQNPVLQEGDTIIVGRSALAATSDTAGLIFSPLTSLLLGIFGVNN